MENSGDHVLDNIIMVAFFIFMPLVSFFAYLLTPLVLITIPIITMGTILLFYPKPRFRIILRDSICTSFISAIIYMIMTSLL